jgi:hypothetical protein
MMKARWQRIDGEGLMSCSANKRAALLLVGLSMKPAAARVLCPLEQPDAEAKAPISVTAGSAAADPKEPPPVKPSREGRKRGSELSLLVGLEATAVASYAYDTRVRMPGADQLRYKGTQRSRGLALFAGGEFTLPGFLRRITIGAGINAAGPNTKDRPVIPSSVSTPFPKASLYSDIQTRYLFRSSWRTALSPFIEHDIGFFHGDRVRAGYQRWGQAGLQTGSFPLAAGSALANYDVLLNLRTNLVRVSVNHHVASDDGSNDSHRSKERPGMIQQWGCMIGTHQTVVIFVAIGPFLQIAH